MVKTCQLGGLLRYSSSLRRWLPLPPDQWNRNSTIIRLGEGGGWGLAWGLAANEGRCV